MPAYIIVQVEVTNPEQYKEYQKFSSIAMQTHGVKVLVRGGQQDVLEGQAPPRTVIMEFPDMAAARAWYESAEYRQAREARAGAAKMNMYVVDGLSV
jgi:uncharacterized protein (DUF1330 family)